VPALWSPAQMQVAVVAATARRGVGVHCRAAQAVSGVRALRRAGAERVTLLTGLSSGEASGQLKLATAYCASAKSYGDSRRDIAVHYGQDIERTKVRRIALEVEQAAMAFAEAERCAQIERLEARHGRSESPDSDRG